MSATKVQLVYCGGYIWWVMYQVETDSISEAAEDARSRGGRLQKARHRGA